jgi:hypothetical protein
MSSYWFGDLTRAARVTPSTPLCVLNARGLGAKPPGPCGCFFSVFYFLSHRQFPVRPLAGLFCSLSPFTPLTEEKPCPIPPNL